MADTTNAEVYAATRRLLQACGTRAANGDEQDFTALLELQYELDEQIKNTARSQAESFGWYYVGATAGISKVGAWRKWGPKRG